MFQELAVESDCLASYLTSSFFEDQLPLIEVASVFPLLQEPH